MLNKLLRLSNKTVLCGLIILSEENRTILKTVWHSGLKIASLKWLNIAKYDLLRATIKCQIP